MSTTTQERKRHHVSHARKSAAKPKGVTKRKRTRAVIYTRVSVDREEQTSTATQARECKQWCEEHGYEVVQTFEELGCSAFSGAPRPALDEAMGMLERGMADSLVVWKLDRFTRSVADSHDLLSRITKADADFISVKEPMLTTDLDVNPMGGMLIQMFVTLAEIESRNIRLRIQPWHDQRRADGTTPCGPAPYGYTRVDEHGVTQANALFIVPSEAAVVVSMATAVLGGASILSQSKAHGFHHRTVHRMLTNPTYAGLRELLNGEVQESTNWLPIITPEMHLALRALLLDPSRKLSVSTERKHLLPSILLCGKPGCGARIQSKSHPAGPRYECSVCRQGIRMDEADAHVRDVLLGLLDDERWAEMQARGRKADITQVTHLTATLAIYREEMEAGIMSHAEYVEKRDQLTARIAELQESEALALPPISSVRDAWDTDAMDVNAKRLVVQAAFKAITLVPRSAGCNGTERIMIDLSDAMGA